MSFPGGWELVLIVGVLVLLFGAAKLPQLARSLGQSARVFKAETRGMKQDEQAASSQDDSERSEPQQLTTGEQHSTGFTATSAERLNGERPAEDKHRNDATN
ncbi:sec-independent protein translocase protein TatA [Actinopolyspora alba]|uniref:Sec-independent protein translocase protein TatA n=1 Tax=Actinopolyspora alba TaxID=673379 RepID=A0A1I1YPH1_9ACTN|nr:Sec-independent protein translocase subunit TatA [Actinopolyspora alba]SFE21436.1 sec-independent protein translocase protein TatA [Actinopolyspora alba]